jgi:membrane protein required for colicin V production
MTWVDLIVLGVLAVSGLLAYVRGFAREALGIGAWIGAVIVAMWAGPAAAPRFQEMLGRADLAQPAGYAAVFIVTLLVLLLIRHWIATLVSDSALGGLDRTLGLVFGFVRGAALVVFAYIAVSMVKPPETWPQPVLQSRSLAYAFEGAQWVASVIPDNVTKLKIMPPPGIATPTADDLYHAPAAGRATDQPATHQ